MPDDAEAARRKAVRNEKLKLGATALNNLAVAAVVAGALAPTIATIYYANGPHGRFWWVYLCLWLTMAGMLHAAARAVLERMQ